MCVEGGRAWGGVGKRGVTFNQMDIKHHQGKNPLSLPTFLELRKPRHTHCSHFAIECSHGRPFKGRLIQLLNLLEIGAQRGK